jgi:hypothetical protein
MVCENGLVISTTEFGKMKIRHMGYDFNELQNTIKSMVEKLPLTVESLNKFREVELNQEQALKFAEDALKCRFNEDEVERIEVDLNDLLTAKRKEDQGSDLWSIYNVIQEKLIHGEFSYKYGTKTRKARKIKNFNKDLELNEKLYDLALEFVS